MEGGREARGLGDESEHRHGPLACLFACSDHYGWEVEAEGKGLFVSFVPIVIDTFFKLWLFTAFNRQSPSTVVTIKEMDRH